MYMLGESLIPQALVSLSVNVVSLVVPVSQSQCAHLMVET